jgi:osmoprotectant transport system ATP-binding protein
MMAQVSLPPRDRPLEASLAASGSVVAFEHVTKRYENGPTAVTDLSLEIRAGEICVLVGPSGCGKTTTMKMINRLVEPTSGRVTIDGADVASLPPVDLRRRIGYVIQQVGLFPHLTVAENVAVVPRLLGWGEARITERVEELLELVGLDPGAHRSRYPAVLSGGERQRVGVARAMAADPSVLLMDEPFGAVDPIRRERLQNEFLRLQARLRKTIVFVTHDVDEAIKMADRIAILQVGGVLAQYDSPDRLLAAPASPFVQHFVGADRGLKRLSLARVRDLPLETPVTVVAGESFAAARQGLPDGTTWALVTDAQQRPLGWIATSDLAGEGTVDAAMATPGSTLLQPESTLRDALSAMLVSSVQLGVVVDEQDAVLGVISVAAISRTLQDGAGSPPP